MKLLSDDELRLLRLLVRRQHHQARERSQTAREIAEALGLSPSALSQYIAKLEARDWARRDDWPEGPGRVLYLARPGLAVQWVSPRRRIAVQWTAHHEVDWEFPLVAQVPDPTARRSLKRFIRLVRRHVGLQSDSHAASGRPFPLVLIVYGSTARGVAAARGDVDLVAVVEPGVGGVASDLEDLAAEASLSGEPGAEVRPIQVVTVTDLGDLPGHLQDAVREEGIIVYDSTHVRWEDRVWNFVYGGRTDG